MHDLARLDLDRHQLVTHLNQKVDLMPGFLVRPVTRARIELRNQCLEHVVLGKCSFKLREQRRLFRKYRGIQARQAPQEPNVQTIHLERRGAVIDRNWHTLRVIKRNLSYETGLYQPRDRVFIFACTGSFTHQPPHKLLVLARKLRW